MNLKIQGNNLVNAEIKTDTGFPVICTFNDDLTKTAMRQYQVRAVFAENMFDKVKELVSDPHIEFVWHNLKELNKLYMAYEQELTRAVRNL